jgi:hypothetical protein
MHQRRASVYAVVPLLSPGMPRLAGTVVTITR